MAILEFSIFNSKFLARPSAAIPAGKASLGTMKSKFLKFNLRPELKSRETLKHSMKILNSKL